MDSTPSTQPTPKKPTSVMNWAILVVVLVVAIVGTIYAMTRNSSTSNSNTNANQNTNAVQVTRPVITKTTNSQNGWMVYKSTELPFEISFPANWHFTEPKPDHPKYATLIVTASNENVDGTEGLSNKSQGLLALVEVERTSIDALQYLTDLGVSPSDIPDNRITIDRYNTETLEFTRRTVDATNLSNWNDAYSVEYIVKSNNVIKLVAFAGRSKTAIDNNQSTITAILQSVK